jgi:hypothetical protein
MGAMLIPFCSVQRMAGPGTGSETTNGITAMVRYQDGTPASFAYVKVRPAWFLRDTSAAGGNRRDSGVIVDTMTDSSGILSLKDIDTGVYSIEVLNTAKSEGALIQGGVMKDSLHDYGIVYLNPLSGISGTINKSDVPDTAAIYVQVYGLDRVKRVDSVTGDFSLDSIPAGNYSIRVITSLSNFMPQTIENISIVPYKRTAIDTIRLASVKTWYNSRNVYLNTTPSGAGVAADIYRFPVLCRLTNDNFDFLTAQSQGGDVRFVKPDNTPLPYHIERWDADAGVAEIWVKVDTVFGNNNSQYFVMLWGNSDAADMSNSGAVFDTVTGFQGVWHMSDRDGVSCIDATDNHYDGVRYAMSAASYTSGEIGGAQRFDGASNYIVLSNTANSKLNFPQHGNYSVSAWVYTESLDVDYHSIVSKSNQQYGLQLNKDNRWNFFEFENRKGWESNEAPAIAKTWKYLVGVRNGSKQYLYIDGIAVDSTITMTADASDRYVSDNVCIGKRTADTTRWWNGMIDEVRICSWSNSANWIKLCYMNQKTDDMLVTYK